MNIPQNNTQSERTRTKVVDEVIKKIKSQGLFDKFRKECLADVDTKPAYRNLQQRVESFVSRFLSKQIWTPKTNKNQMRDMLRKHVNQSALLISGVERIVEQALNPKIFTTIKPKIDEVVCEHLGIDIVARRQEIEDKREQERLLQQPAAPVQLMSIDTTYVEHEPTIPAVTLLTDMPKLSDPPFPTNWQQPQFPQYLQAPYPASSEYPSMSQFGVSQQYMHEWGSHHSSELAAPGTEELPTVPPPILNESTEPEDMDLCEELPEPPPLPPEPEPPPDDEERPALPPEPPEEEDSPYIDTPPLDTADLYNLSIPLGDTRIPLNGTEPTEENQVTEEIVEMEIDGSSGQFVEGIPLPDSQEDDKEAEEGPMNKYHFNWTNDLDVDISDVDSVSSIHTSDLSSFSDSEISISEEDATIEPPLLEVISEIIEPSEPDAPYSPKSQSPPPAVCEEVVTPSKPTKIIPNFSDSEEEESREDRKIRIALETADRLSKRQRRRAELEIKRRDREEKARAKELKKTATSTDVPTDTDQKPSSTEDTTVAESPTKSSPEKRRKTKSQLKEELREQKVYEKRRALRRQRTRNKRYTSDEFTSIFTDSKRPFASRSYDTIVDDYIASENVVLCEDVITEPLDENIAETLDISDTKLDNLNEYITIDSTIIEEDDLVNDIKPNNDYNVTDDKQIPNTSLVKEDDNSQLNNDNDDETKADDSKSTKSPKSTTIHKSPKPKTRDTSPFSDVSDVSLTESIPEVPETKRGRRPSTFSHSTPDRRTSSAISPSESDSKGRSQRYDMDDLYKPRTSRRRATSPLMSLDTSRKRRTKSGSSSASNQRDTTAADTSDNMDTTAGVDGEAAEGKIGEGNPAATTDDKTADATADAPKSRSTSRGRSQSSSSSSSSHSGSRSFSRSRSRSFSRSPPRSTPSKRHRADSRDRYDRRDTHTRRRRSVTRVDFGMAAQHARMRDMGYVGMPHPMGMPPHMAPHSQPHMGPHMGPGMPMHMQPHGPNPHMQPHVPIHMQPNMQPRIELHMMPHMPRHMPRPPPQQRWTPPDYYSDSHSRSRSASPTPSNSSHGSVHLAARRTDYHRRSKKRELSDTEQPQRSVSPTGSVISDDDMGSLKAVSSTSRSMSPPELQAQSTGGNSPYLEPISREGSDADSPVHSPSPKLNADGEDGELEVSGGELETEEIVGDKADETLVQEVVEVEELEEGETASPPATPSRRHRSPAHHSPPHHSPDMGSPSPRRHAVRHSRRVRSPPHRYSPSPPRSRRAPHPRPRTRPPHYPDPMSPDPMYPYERDMRVSRMPVPEEEFPYGVSRTPDGPPAKRSRHM